MQVDVSCCSYALGELMDKAGIGLPEDFEQEDRDIRITGLQNNYEKVYCCCFKHQLFTAEGIAGMDMQCQPSTSCSC